MIKKNFTKRWVLRSVLKKTRKGDWRIADGSEFQTVGTKDGFHLTVLWTSFSANEREC